jgi:hypothetical protein
MKTRNFLMGLLFSLAMVRTAAAMGASDAAYDGGGGPASLFLTVLPFLLIIGL